MAVIVWFRRDLRMADSPALAAAAASGEPVVPLYLHDEAAAPGAASRWWLHGSLEALARDLARLGAPLLLRRGNPADALPTLAREVGAKAIFWNRCYEPADIARDKALKADLSASGIAVKSFGASLLAEPWEVKTAAGDPYKVFTPFWRTLSGMEIARPLPAPRALPPAPPLPSDDLAAWNFRPSKPDWASGLRAAWTPGEKGAAARLVGFLDGPVAAYAEARDYPARDATSRLSPHLHWGEISPRQIWHAAKLHADAFVGIEAEHPVVLRLRNGERLLAAEPVERTLDHASAGRACDGHGVVGGAAVHHHHVVAERRGGCQAVPNAIGLVLGDHAKGKGPCGHRERHQVRGRVGSRHNAMSSSAECRP